MQMNQKLQICCLAWPNNDPSWDDCVLSPLETDLFRARKNQRQHLAPTMDDNERRILKTGLTFCLL